MQAEFVHVDKNLLRVKPEKIIKLLGEQEEKVDAYSAELVNHYIEKCLQVSSPEAAYILAEALEAGSSSEIAIPKLSFHSGKIISKMLKRSESYALFLVTAGPGPEQLARKLLEEGNYLEGYIADLVASYMVEFVADQVQDQIRKFAGESKQYITNRYSPGYCSWKVDEQQKLFSLFPADCCGVSLSESSLMNPVKSASGIIGIGAEVKYRDYTCEICSMPDCKFREAKAT